MLISLFMTCLVTLTAAQIQKKDPSACDGCVTRKGVGFNPHPTDSTQFVQCYFKRGNIVEPVYRNCENWGEFYDHGKLRCLPSKYVNSTTDKCKTPGVLFYKHSDPNKCGAYWQCIDGAAHPRCCPVGQAFHPRQGCIPMPTCTDMCPDKDRVPGCARMPISGSPTRYKQYIGEGEWRTVRCPKGNAYNPADCSCSIRDIIVAGRVCKPDVSINFDRIARDAKGNKIAVDISGNNHKVTTEGVQFYRGAAYFDGSAKLNIEELKTSSNDEGVYIIKLRFKEQYKQDSINLLQALVTNGHCGTGVTESIMIAKRPGFVLVGADCEKTRRSFPVPTVNKPWKEVIYIQDKEKLEARVCGATKNGWAVGKLKDTGCGLQFGNADRMHGFVGLIDDIQVYRCKPLEAVINLNY